MKITVIIATYRRAASLGRTLRTIVSQHHKPEEVIIVDQSPAAERNRVVAVIEQAVQAGLNVRAIWSDNPSSTQARNLGLAAAMGDWVIFSDDDVDWPPSVAGNLASKAATSPELAMIAARDTNSASGPRPLWRRMTAALFLTNTLFPLRRGKVMACMQARYPQPIVGDMDSEWATGYWFAVDRTFLVKHGLRFDEKLFRYAQAEDMLFTHQVYLTAKSEGRRCIVSESIAVAHLVSQEWREPDSFADLCGAWNRIYIASRLRTGVSFWLSLAAIYWAAIHQTLVRIVRRRGWLGHLKAYAAALGNLSAIRAGDFEMLYARYERKS
jgi:glycosyltransferase involved in cell wall biosynthesis